MDTKTAREIGKSLAGMIHESSYQAADQVLFPILSTRTPFRILDVIGNELGFETLDSSRPYYDHIAERSTMGGWIIIASALHLQSKIELSAALSAVCDYVIAADIWYAADSFGERVPGHALVELFEPTVAILSAWRQHPNRWVRRMVGVSVHYWAKQARGKSIFASQVERLLELLEPMFTEREQDAIKGIGWGLKTLGRYYPEIVTDWLLLQLDRPHHALMLRKAVKYLPADLREKVTGKTE